MCWYPEFYQRAAYWTAEAHSSVSIHTLDQRPGFSHNTCEASQLFALCPLTGGWFMTDWNSLLIIYIQVAPLARDTLNTKIIKRIKTQ